MYLVVSTSLNKASRSRRLAEWVSVMLTEQGHTASTLDLASFRLPIDDGGSLVGHAELDDVKQLIGASAGLLLVLPVYRGDVAVSARNLIQLTDQVWNRKVVGMACVTGNGANASVMGLANTLMLQHRAFIVPDFVFVESSSLNRDELSPGGLLDRPLRKLVQNLTRMTEALRRA